MKRFELSHQKNIRDLGGLKGYQGKTIKYGHFYRGGALHKVNDEDMQILIGMHITDVVDFRGEEEFLNIPDAQIPGAKYHSFPAIEEKIEKDPKDDEDGNLLWFVGNHKGFDHMKAQYRNLIIDEKSRNAYRGLFKILMEENKSVYFHCSQGKDRAGLASFFIEAALGVDYEDMKKDYLLSNIAMEERVDKIASSLEGKPFFTEQYRQSLYDVFAARLEYLESAIDEMNKHGGPLEYIRNILGVDIEKFRNMYLEGEESYE